MVFLNPTYLWALLGLAVPIAIHLWSRKEGRTIKVGSINLLRESDPKQSSSIRINEWWLLFLRLLLLAILVFIMAGLQIKIATQNASLTYLVEPSLLQDEKMRTVWDTLQEGAELRLLKTGFPEVEEDFSELSSSEAAVPFSTVPPDYWQLATEMEDLTSDSIVVFTRGLASGFKGQRPVSRRGTSWIPIPEEKGKREYVEAVLKQDSIQLVAVYSDAEILKFEIETLSSESNRFQISAEGDSIRMNKEAGELQLSLREVDSLAVSIFYRDSLKKEMRYMRASFNALSKYLDRPIEVNVFQELDSLRAKKEDVLIWLSSEPVEEGEHLVLQYNPDSLASKLIVPGPSRNHFYLTGGLTSENLIGEHFAEQVYLFLNFHPHLLEEVRPHDRRSVSRDMLFPREANGERSIQERESKDVSGWLWLLLLLILLAERSLAQSRKQ